jgi:hypothetical protein
MTQTNTTTRFARILAGYVTIGIVFGTALSGGPCGKNQAAKPDVSQAAPRTIACEHLGHNVSLLSHVSHAAKHQPLLSD